MGASAGVSQAASGPTPRSLVRVAYFSPLIHRRDYYLVHLPPGYTAAARRGVRFPVVYLLHGDGIGVRHTALNMYEKGRVAETADRLVRSGQARRFLIVMPESDDGTRLDDMEWANTRHGAYMDEIVGLVHKVDRRWATIADRSARAIGGLSMGGYGAVNIALRNPQLFGTVESWSGYFTQTPTAVYAHASAAELHDSSPAAYLHEIAGTLRGFPMRFLLYGGNSDRLTDQQAPFARQLRALGFAVQTATFPGAHSYSLWAKRMPLALRFASVGLTGP